MDLLRAGLGIELQSADFLTIADILHGSGTPGGDAAEQDAAPIGSIYMDVVADAVNLQLWWKYRTTQNDATDWRQATSKDYVDSLVNGLSWREPAVVLDPTTYANITAAETAANVGNLVDGITIQPGDRILFTDLTTGNDNIYIVSGSAGAWTFTEDLTNLATDGDALLVEQGTFAEEQWTFDGTTWVKMASVAGNLELGYIRDFIGKTGPGIESPTYTSTDIITPSSSLESAVGQLDAIIGTMTFTEQNVVVNGVDVTGNLDALDIQLGTGDHTGANIVLTANDVTENLTALDTAIGDRLYVNNTYLTDGESITASLDALATELGNEVTSLNWLATANTVNANLDALDTEIGTMVFTNGFHVTNGSTVTAAVDALDIQIGSALYTNDFVVTDGETTTASIDALDTQAQIINNQSLVVQTANVTTQQVVDSHLLVDVDVAKWIVSVENTGDSTNRVSAEVHALHNGTVADYNRFSVLQHGANISGLVVDVDVSGGLMRLLVTSTTPVDVSVKRLAAHTIN